jgi:hypothetical protein
MVRQRGDSGKRPDKEISVVRALRLTVAMGLTHSCYLLKRGPASRFRNLLLLAIAVPLCFGGLNAKANLLTDTIVSNQFSLTGQAKIVLSGAVAWDDVLFNVVGNGSDVKVSGQSILNGVLMANNRTVDLSAGAIVNGEVVANKIKLSGSSVINHPPVISN